MDYKKATSISNGLLAGSMFALLGTVLASNPVVQIVCFILGVAMIIGGILVRIIFWRCPHCKKALKLGFGMEPKNCPHCREPLMKPKQ